MTWTTRHMATVETMLASARKQAKKIGRGNTSESRLDRAYCYLILRASPNRGRGDLEFLPFQR